MMDKTEVFPCVIPYVLEGGYKRFGRTSCPVFSVGVNMVMWPNYTTGVMWVNKLEDGGLLHQDPTMVTANVAEPVPVWEYQLLYVIESEDGQKSSTIILVPSFNPAGKFNRYIDSSTSPTAVEPWFIFRQGQGTFLFHGVPNGLPPPPPPPTFA
jgi:hypothetical protein